MNKVEKAVIDLDGEWGKDCTEKHVLVSAWREDKGEFRYVFWYPNWEWRAEAETICTYPEFMEARKRLENKPEDWEGDYLTHQPEGQWHSWIEDKPRPLDGIWRSERGHHKSYEGGHVFGDWRQSLEPRPQPDNKEGEGVKWDGEGLPPVGVECEIDFLGTPQGTGFVKFYGDEYCVIQNTADLDRREQVGRMEEYKFHPIQSHRDKVIEAAETECGGIVDTGAVIRHLYEIGMLVYPGDDQ